MPTTLGLNMQELQNWQHTKHASAKPMAQRVTMNVAESVTMDMLNTERRHRSAVMAHSIPATPTSYCSRARVQAEPASTQGVGCGNSPAVDEQLRRKAWPSRGPNASQNEPTATQQGRGM